MGRPTVFICAKNVHFQTTAWFKPTRNLNTDNVVFSFACIFDQKHPHHNVNGDEYPYFDSLQFDSFIQSIKKLDDFTIEIRL